MSGGYRERPLQRAPERAAPTLPSLDRRAEKLIQRLSWRLPYFPGWAEDELRARDDVLFWQHVITRFATKPLSEVKVWDVQTAYVYDDPLLRLLQTVMGKFFGVFEIDGTEQAPAVTLPPPVGAAMEELAQTTVLDALMGILGEGEAGERSRRHWYRQVVAARLIVATAPEAAVDALRGVLFRHTANLTFEDDDHEFVHFLLLLLHGLERCGGEAFVSAASHLLQRDPCSKLRKAASLGLEREGSAEAISALADAASAEDVWRGAGSPLHTLEQVAKTRGHVAVAHLADHPKDRVRVVALSALAASDEPDREARLQHALETETAYVKAALVRAIPKEPNNARAAANGLRSASDDKTFGALLTFLEQAEDSAVLPTLREVLAAGVVESLGDDDAVGRALADKALKSLSPDAKMDDLPAVRLELRARLEKLIARLERGD